MLRRRLSLLIDIFPPTSAALRHDAAIIFALMSLFRHFLFARRSYAGQYRVYFTLFAA